MIRGVKRPLPAVGLGGAILALVAACASPAPPAPVVYKGSNPVAGATAAVAQRPVAQRPVAQRSAARPVAASRSHVTSRSKTAYRLDSGDDLPSVATPAAPAEIQVSELPPPKAAPVTASAVTPASRPAPEPAAGGDGRVHVVRPGETIYSISRAYGVDTYALAKLNEIPTPFRINAGQALRLPGGGATATEMAAATSSAPTPASGEAPREGARQPAMRPPIARMAAAAAAGDQPVPIERPTDAAQQSETRQAALVQPPTPPVRAGQDFAWPVQGRVVSEYGPKPGGLHNDGINIGAPEGTPVRAAENGVVAYAGNELKGFGSMLLIRHADGWITAYAHNQKVLVGVGDTVKRGQVVARVGSTGSVASPQLHFELRKGATAVDPLRHLAEREALTSALSVRSSAPGAGRPDPG